MDDNKSRTRSKRQQIKVTFPTGKTICYGNVTTTMLETLKEIGPDRFGEIKLEIGHLPIISQTIYPKYKDYMREICPGWYLNTQTTTDAKYLQLCAINNALNLGLKIEIGTDLVKDAPSGNQGKSKVRSRLKVRMQNGEVIEGASSSDTFLEAIRRLGVDKIWGKDIRWGDNPLITVVQKAPTQVEIEKGRWLTVPNSNKDKAKLLKVIALRLHLPLEVSME